MATGQCHTDPVTGISGEIYTAWTGANDAGLTAGATTEGDPIRDLLSAQIEAVATAIDTHGGGDHSLGQSVTWTAGTGLGQYQFGAAIPNAGTIAVTGCDEGGRVQFVSNAGTGSGIAFRIYFAEAFPHAPDGTISPGNAAAAHVFFGSEWHFDSTADYAEFFLDTSNMTNTTYVFHWIVKGRT